MTQLEVHKKIDEFFKAGVDVADVEYGKKLRDHNPDSKKYFFAKADENWLDWLLNNGFLDKIKEKAEDPTKFFYRLSELDYLTGMAEKKPSEVANIILSVSISEETFNPEVIDRFLWIISDMPAEQIKTLAGKIRKDGWVYLMRKFNKSDFEFNKMVKKLAEAKEYDALIEITRAMLLIKTNEEAEEARKRFSDAEFFYLNYINEVGLFEILTNLDDPHSEEALKILAEVLGKIIKQKGKSKNDVFEYEDFFALYDADIFTIDFNKQGRSRLREDFESLVISIKKLIEKISREHPDKETAERLLEIINDLPENHLVWRLRLFFLSRYPQIFKNEIISVFFKAFEVGKRYFEITGGAEYHQLLVQCFSALDSEIKKREYVKKVFDYFNAKLDDKDKEKWRRRDGGKILCFIKNSLTHGEKKDAKDKFGISPDEAECTPTPISSGSRGGMVRNLSPVNLSDFTVEQIIAKLKSDWTPEKFKEQYKGDDFLSPRGAEGLGDALKEDIKKRVDKYLKNITSFFNREKIHSHYLYSILRGIEESLRDKLQLNLEQIDQILVLFEAIKAEGRENAFEKKERNHGAWLVDWIEVHRVITDVLLFMVESKAIREGAHKEYRKKIIDIIEYLLDIKASPSKEDEKPEYGEPFHIAINSVRGRAYQVFTAFIQNDGEKLAPETKEIFKKVLADDTMAVRFVVGHYLAAFYFRDKDFITGLFSEIFPKDEPAKKDLYLAAWEGYLISTLYDKLFADLKGYYLYAITLKPEEYTKRKYSKDLDEALAVHLALAFVHLGLKRSDDLFEQFWKEPNIKRHQEFISFVGRDCLSRNQIDDKWIEENVDKNKLIDFWNWALEHAEPKALSGFGFWINQEKEVLDDKIVAEKMAETLKKSGGEIEWDYALMKRLPVFAEKNGDKTLDIISNYLLDSEQKKLNQNSQAPLSYRDEIKQALEVIYKNGDGETKQKATDLINTLIEKGSSMFWGLKEVISK